MSYIVLEYLASMLMVLVLAALLFGASVLALATKESASRLAETSRKVAGNALANLQGQLPALSPENSVQNDGK